VIALVLAAVVAAAPADTGQHLHFTADAGLVTTSGNTDNTSINVGDKIVGIAGAWTFTQVFAVIYGRNDSVLTSSSWRGSLRGERAVSSRVGIFVLTEFDRDTFAGIASRYTPQFGASVAAVAAPRDTLRAELGATYTWQNAFAPDTARTSAGARMALRYVHQFTSKSTISEAIEYLPNLQVGADYRINSETTLTAPISRGLSFKADYAIRYNGLPEPGFKTTDRVLTTGIQVTF
jgi:putative salt-induced outer membrane protein YdiY